MNSDMFLGMYGAVYCFYSSWYMNKPDAKFTALITVTPFWLPIVIVQISSYLIKHLTKNFITDWKKTIN